MCPIVKRISNGEELLVYNAFKVDEKIVFLVGPNIPGPTFLFPIDYEEVTSFLGTRVRGSKDRAEPKLQ